jgi:hypothetical protein
VRFEVDWRHGAEHMRDQHQISVEEANEALADADALLYDPTRRAGQEAVRG